MKDQNLINRIKGVIFGQAIGDALGLGTEFMTTDEVTKSYPNGLTRYDQIIQDAHRCRWNKGDWTDDTDMMLCIADAIVADKGEVDYMHIANNFKSWFNGNPLGIGRHTFNVLCMGDYIQSPFQAAEIIWTLYKKRSAANGGLMRTSVIGVLDRDDIETVAKNVCLLTHPDARCVGSSVILSMMIHELVFNSNELTFDNIISIGNRYDSRIESFVALARDAISIQELELDGVDMGYTLKTLAVALWAFWHCLSFEEGLLKVVNAGGDADTNAAVACSLLGAKYGFGLIPEYYIRELTGKDKLNKICEDFMALTQ